MWPFKPKKKESTFKVIFWLKSGARICTRCQHYTLDLDLKNDKVNHWSIDGDVVGKIPFIACSDISAVTVEEVYD